MSTLLILLIWVVRAAFHIWLPNFVNPKIDVLFQTRLHGTLSLLNCFRPNVNKPITGQIFNGCQNVWDDQSPVRTKKISSSDNQATRYYDVIVLLLLMGDML